MALAGTGDRPAGTSPRRQLEELEASAIEDELAAETAAARTTTVAAFTRKRSSRRPFPAHLPRERVVVPGPMACALLGRRGWVGRALARAVTDLQALSRQPSRSASISAPSQLPERRAIASTML